MNRSDAAKKAWIARRKKLGTARGRFWNNVDKNGPRQPWMKTNCHIWTGGKTSTGYGYLIVKGIQTRAHRFSYAEFVEPIPEGLWVLHHCDTPACCRKEHLYAGTHQDNVDDLWRRHDERQRAAISAAQLKVPRNPADILRHRIWIRCYENGMQLKPIAEVFQVWPGTIQHIIRAAKLSKNPRTPHTPAAKAKIKAARAKQVMKKNPIVQQNYKEWRDLRAHGLKCKEIAKLYKTTACAVSQGTR